MTLRRPGAFGGAIAGSIATSFGLRNFVSSSRPCPSGVRIMTMSTRTPSRPLTRSTHGPSSGVLPSIVMPSAVKKAMAASRSSTTTLTWSNLRIVTAPIALCGPSFDHPVRTRQDRLRNLDAERFGGLEIDHQLDTRRQLDRKIGGLGALGDLVDVGRELPVRVPQVGAIRHE